MNVGNFLTVISILIAFASFAYNSNRKIILYKFTCCDVIVTIIFLLLANYLLLFDWFEVNGWYVDCFMHEGTSYLLPNQWAYVLTMFFLIYVIIKVFVCNNIPKVNRKKLLAYYEELILSDIPFLINCIRKYHQREILKNVAELNKVVKEDEEKAFFAWGEPEIESKNSEPIKILQRIVINH